MENKQETPSEKGACSLQIVFQWFWCRNTVIILTIIKVASNGKVGIENFSVLVRIQHDIFNSDLHNQHHNHSIQNVRIIWLLFFLMKTSKISVMIWGRCWYQSETSKPLHSQKKLYLMFWLEQDSIRNKIW